MDLDTGSRLPQSRRRTEQAADNPRLQNVRRKVPPGQAPSPELCRLGSGASSGRIASSVMEEEFNKGFMRSQQEKRQFQTQIRNVLILARMSPGSDPWRQWKSRCAI